MKYKKAIDAINKNNKLIPFVFQNKLGYMDLAHEYQIPGVAKPSTQLRVYFDGQETAYYELPSGEFKFFIQNTIMNL